MPLPTAWAMRSAARVNVLDLSCVILGGGMAVPGTRWWARTTAAVARQLLLPADRHPVVPPALGAHAALVGAAIAAEPSPEGAFRDRAHPGVLRGTLVVSCQAYEDGADARSAHDDAGRPRGRDGRCIGDPCAGFG